MAAGKPVENGGTPGFPDPAPALGLRENLAQFSLLVLVTAFVGGMVGLERAILPLIAEREFGLVSKSVILSFIVGFGFVKAFTNLAAGRFSDRIGRKGLLVAGWIVGLPVPFLLMWAPSWGWITFANLLLGINQGLCWSTTVIMKIDLVGPQRRGLAMGLNEFSGYLAVSLAALATGYIAGAYGLRPAPFYLGVGFVVLGLILSIFFVRETRGHARHEAKGQGGAVSVPFKEIFTRTSYRDPNLFSCSQAGMVNNLNDGMAWGLFPLFFAAAHLSVERIAVLAATYPAVWGICQLGTGALSDRIGRKWLIAGGMWVQAVGIGMIAATASFLPWMAGTVLLGVGTAMVYPTLLAAIGDIAHPSWRASAVGVYRLWRDAGYAFGALLAGILADHFGVVWAIVAVGVLTFISGAVVSLRMSETLKQG
jgi:MFS family permease